MRRVAVKDDTGRSMEVKCDALVLRAVDYRDSDRILTLFAAGLGKITASCKGVRKASAKLRFAAQPFCFAEYVLAERNGRYTVTSAYLHDGFYAIREDIQKFYAASAIVEMCAILLPDGMESDGLLAAGVHALSGICEGNESEELIRFMVRALSIAGYDLDLDGCLSCGREPEGRCAFSFDQGGFFCRGCAAADCVPASETTYRTLRAIKGGGCGREELEKDGLRRSLRLLREYFAAKTGAHAESLAEYIRIM